MMQSQERQSNTQLMIIRNALRLGFLRFIIFTTEIVAVIYHDVLLFNQIIYNRAKYLFLSFQVEKGVNTALSCLISSKGTCTATKFSQVR